MSGSIPSVSGSVAAAAIGGAREGRPNNAEEKSRWAWNELGHPVTYLRCDDLARTGLFVGVNKFNPGFLSHRMVHRIFGVPWNHGDVRFMNPFHVRRHFAEHGLGIVRLGLVDTPPYPDSLGIRDMKLHRMNVDLNKIDWDSRTIQLPLPLSIKLFYAHLFYVLAVKS